MEKSDRKMEANWCLNFSKFMGSHHHLCDQGARPSGAIDCTKLSLLTSNFINDQMVECSSSQVSGCTTAVTGTHKQKSRWDRPNDPVSPWSIKKQNILPNLQQNFYSSAQPEIVEAGVGHMEGARQGEKSNAGSVHNCSGQIECSKADSARQDLHDDVPPGFSPPIGGSQLQMSTVLIQCLYEMSVGQLQERFYSRLPVAYGIPTSVIQEFGTP
ncbi:hypothetical protein Nepgr_002767 [Nepenthes gracilis]|uniref:Uncharacterized protein n=1 Tax=Nepenthes gracilis TaxID=150966 RepID=A0AAD3P7L0_NEPGR|nr:hypothetical protein Nepgr_002767 [Nepenthes gracilis]